MTPFFDAAGLSSLLWPLVLCAAAWGIMVWALRQRDPVSEAVDGLLSPRASADAAAAAVRLDADRAENSVDRSQRTHRMSRPS